MKCVLRMLFFGFLLSITLLRVHAQAGTCAGMTLGQNSSLNGFVPFPATDLWRQDVSNALVDANSDAILATIGANVGLHPDFGSGEYDNSKIGIPYQVVSGAPPVKITYTAYGDQSDPGPMAIPANARIEGYPNPPYGGDAHVLILDRDNCWLYELYAAQKKSATSWDAASGVAWDLLNDEARPYTWGSADAAGLPIFPGLARYDEVKRGVINHALRFTLGLSMPAFVPPANHWASDSTNPYAAPMGMRMRLRAGFDISGFSPQAKVILTALKKYGMIMADNGSSMFLTGAPSNGWNDDDLHTLGQVTAADFEVLQETPLYSASNIPQGSAPAIDSFIASSKRIASGEPVTLSWTATGGSYFIVSPEVGAIRGNSVVVTPTATTTYTLYSTNQFGRTMKTVKVTVE